MAVTPKKRAFRLSFRNKSEGRRGRGPSPRPQRQQNYACAPGEPRRGGGTDRHPLPAGPCSTKEKGSRYAKAGLRPSNTLPKRAPSRGGLAAGRLLFGRYGVCFKEHGVVHSKYVETAQLDTAKSLRKKGRVWTRLCADTPASARPAETRMGKGKGSVSAWTARVAPGQLFFEFSGIPRGRFRAVYQKLREKSPLGLKMLL